MFTSTKVIQIVTINKQIKKYQTKEINILTYYEEKQKTLLLWLSPLLTGRLRLDDIATYRKLSRESMTSEGVKFERERTEKRERSVIFVYLMGFLCILYTEKV